ncbi:hypothetical protein C1H46_001908 [Malus baccata]|uniref:Uncharacterized protein n=1 Tax=Malus baccata TaxID=106549 RepID=A0A540NN99_MALBA|nr:hypothetical protein C1H46_001908 [Malus baccata]
MASSSVLDGGDGGCNDGGVVEEERIEPWLWDLGSLGCRQGGWLDGWCRCRLRRQ